MNFIFFITLFLFSGGCKNNNSAGEPQNISVQTKKIGSTNYDTTIIPGAESLDAYLPLIQNKYVALVVNQTSVIGKTHLVDTLLKLGIKIQVIFAPEHGFRGTEDAGATVMNSKDDKTGLPVVSLYGNKKMPSAQDLADVDVLIYDIQDVGVRFYTYISTLRYVMEACAKNNKQLIVLDRPNPNGFYIDGPVLKKEFASFVGLDPVPVVYGMTAGEYALMINGEHWLPDTMQCNLKVIPCKNYNHKKYYEIKIPPSPNLKTMKAIYLYPSLCFFEGTNVSVGRGTDKPFEIYGSPQFTKTGFTFIPVSKPASKVPPFMNKVCNGFNLSVLPVDSIRTGKINLQYLIRAYNAFENKNDFFLETGFFNKLAGNNLMMEQIKAGLTEDEIRLSWQDELTHFKQIRKKYLLYPDFE